MLHSSGFEHDVQSRLSATRLYSFTARHKADDLCCRNTLCRLGTFLPVRSTRSVESLWLYAVFSTLIEVSCDHTVM